MPEYASRGPSHTSTYASSSSASYSSGGERADPAAEQARRLVMSFEIDVVAVSRASEAVTAAHAANDRPHWCAAREHLDRELVRVEKARARVRERITETAPETAQRLTNAERQLEEHAATASTLDDPPRGYRPVAREDAMLAALGADQSTANYVEVLEAELTRVSAVESKQLLQRARGGEPSDPFVAGLGAFSGDQRSNILAYLADAGKRALARRRKPPGAHAPAVDRDAPLREMLERGEVDPAVLATLDGTTRRALARRLQTYRPGSGDVLGAQFARLERATRLELIDALHRSDQLPGGLRSELEAASGQSLDHVRVHAGAHGDAVATSHGARAVAIGAEIFMADGQLDAESGEGRELVAHEVAHVLQAGLATPTTAADPVVAAEAEADTFAARFRSAGAAARFRPSVGIVSGAALRAPAVAHDRFVAQMTGELAVADRHNLDITAPAYLHLHTTELRNELAQFLVQRPFIAGDPQVAFVPGFPAFLEALLRSFDTDDAAARVTRLRQWVAPHDLYSIVDRNRAIFEHTPAQRGLPDDGLDYEHGAKGPALWSHTVALAIGEAIEARLNESLARMAPQLVAATAKHRSHGGRASASELVPGHPLDWQVALAMVGRGEPTVTVASGALNVVAAPSYRRVTSVHWQGADGGAWNAARVTPDDAGVEAVAAAILGAPTEAYRIRRVGAYYLVDESVAARIPEANRYRLGHVDSLHELAFGAKASEVEHAEVERRVTPTSAAPAVAVLEQQWQAIEDQLQGIRVVARRYALETPLGPALDRHRHHHDDLATLSGHEAVVRGELFRGQHELLTTIAVQVSALAQPEIGGPVRQALAALVEAASFAHLPDTGAAKLAEATTAQRGAVTEGLELALGEAATAIEVIRQAPAQARGGVQNSEAAFEVPLAHRAEALRLRVAGLRTGLQKGTVEAQDVEAVARDVETLRFDATIVMEIAELGKLFETLGALEDNNWVLFSEALKRDNDVGADNRIGRLENSRRGAMKLRQQLDVIHVQWLAAERSIHTIAAQLAAGKDGQAAEAEARKLVRPTLDAIHAQLAELGGDAGVQEFLRTAYERIEDVQERARIVALITIIGIAIASTLTGNLAGAALEGLGAGAMAVQLGALAAETTMFTALNARMSGEPMLHAFLSNSIGNLLTFGAVRGVRAVMAATRVGKAVAIAKAGGQVRFAALAAAKTAEFTAELLVTQAVQVAQAEYESLLATGHTASLAELEDNAKSAMAMMIGAHIGHVVLGASIANAHRVLGEHVGALRERVRRIASGVETSGDEGSAIDLIQQTRAYLDAEVARTRELAAKSDAELAREGITRGEVSELQRKTAGSGSEFIREQGAEVLTAIGLHTVVPGQVYSGTADRVHVVVEAYRAKGYKIVETTEGIHIARSGENPIEIFVHRDAASAVAIKGERAPAKSHDDHEIETVERQRDQVRRMPAQVDARKVDAQMREKQHSGADLHSHFMGNVEPERFRDELAASGMMPMRHGDPHAASPGGKIGDVSEWEPLLREIKKLQGGEADHVYTADERIHVRGPSGDAIREADLAEKQILKLKTQLVDAKESLATRIRAEIDDLARDAVAKALRTSANTDFNSSYEVRDQLVKRFYGASDRARVLGASGEHLLPNKQKLLAHFKGRTVVEQRIERAAQLEAQGSLDAPESKQLGSLRKLIEEQFAYDRYAEDTIVRLARDGVTYTEQSNSVKKLAERFDPGQLAWLRERAKLDHPELAGALDQLVVKHIAMINTRSFGERDAPEQGDVRDKGRMDDAAFQADVATAVAMTDRGDVVGIDIAGMEHFRFDADGGKRFEYVYDQLAAAALRRGQHLTLRPHVGEGANDVMVGEPYGRDHSRQVTADKSQLSHYERAHTNLEALIGVLETIAARPQNRSYNGKLPPEVIVRFGHATHADGVQAGRLAKLGVIVEVNLSSNEATGASATAKPDLGSEDRRTAPGAEVFPSKNAAIDDHALGTLVFHEVDVMLSTDGHEVMNTTLGTEFARARSLIADVIADRRSISVTVSEALEMNFEGGHVPLGTDQLTGEVTVTYTQMSRRKKQRFDLAYRRFYDAAIAYVGRYGSKPDGVK